MTTSQAVGGVYGGGYNSYPSGAGTFNVSNGYSAYPGFESVNGFGFAFRKKAERIDWRKLASVDVDLVARNLDFQTLQDNISNVAFCSLETELDLRCVDPNYVKLFKLSQLMIEYLLHSQDYLWSKMQEVQQELAKEKSEHEITKKDIVDKMKTEIFDLKKELTQRKKIIAVQQQLIHNGNDAIHRCQFCTKAFVNQTFLQAHLSRRHPEYVNRQTLNSSPEVIKGPVPMAVAPSLSREVENELLEIRERLRRTEAQLVEERNARNASAQKENKSKQHDDEMMKRFELWKEEQLDEQKNEIEKVQNMFMKELKNLNGKLQAAEENLEEFKHKRVQGSMLGSLKDDVDAEDLKKQRKRMTEDMKKEMQNQVAEVEMRMRSEMMDQQKSWKKKMRDLKYEEEQKLRLKEEEVDRLRSEENKRRQKDEEERRRTKSEAVNRMSKIESKKRSTMNGAIEPEIKKEETNVAAMPRSPQLRAKANRVSDSDDEGLESEEDKNEDYHRVREAQAAHLRTLQDNDDDDEDDDEDDDSDDDDDDDDDFPLVNNREKLVNDPDLIRACRSDVLQQLELALGGLGIPKTATGVKDEIYRRNVDTLDRERSRKHMKRSDNFNIIRRKEAEELEQRAHELLKQRPKSMIDSNQPKTPPSGRSTLRSQGRADSLPPQQVKRTPRPSPRAGTLPSRMISTGQSMMTTQSFTSTGTLSVTGASAKHDHEVDHPSRGSSSQKRVVVMEPRPRAKTPPGLKPSATAPAGSQLQRQAAAEQESDEVSSDWDETSNMESAAKARTPRQLTSSLRSPRNSTVSMRKAEIEKQLMARDSKKPFGGVDLTPMKSGSTIKKTKFEDDIDVLSLTSVSAADELKPMPKPRHSTVQSSVQSSSAPTVSSVTYGTSKWGSSASVGESLSSFDEKKVTASRDSWDDEAEEDYY